MIDNEQYRKLKDIFIFQLSIHRILKPQDAVKLCFQNCFGPGHMITDSRKSQKIMEEEFEIVQLNRFSCAEIEEIGNEYVRVPLNSEFCSKVMLPYLNQMFMITAEEANQNQKNQEKQFYRELEILKQLAFEKLFSFSFDEYSSYLSEYLKSGIHAVHHSEEYRNLEKPHYRVINKRFIRLFPLVLRIHQCLNCEKGRFVPIAFDGRCASGKTTAAKDVVRIMGGNYISMDDFFLPVHLRTAERFKRPGGNVHIERFDDEVAKAIRSQETISYHCYDCHQMKETEYRHILEGGLLIVEGAYCLLPEIRDLYSWKVFFDITPEEQKRRIVAREGKDGLENFENRWIPLEEKYLSYYKIEEICDEII